MATSIHEGIVELADALYGSADRPVSAAVTRDGIANGLLHAADSMGQVRVNFMGVADAVDGGQALELAPEGNDENTAYLLACFGPWPLTLRADGTPYACRLRLAGFSSGGQGGEVTFDVVLAPDYPSALIARSTSVDYRWSVSTSGSSSAWLAGSSQGSRSDATLLSVPRDVALSWVRSASVWNGTSESDPRAVEQCLVSAWVFSSPTFSGSNGVLTALHLAEYIEP